jgi:hypothetical protein
MRNRLKTDRGHTIVPATYRGPLPGDFPVGSIQSRAAARAVLTAYRKEQREVEEAEVANLSPPEQALIEGVESPQVRSWMIRLLRHAQEIEIIYGKASPWPTAEEIRHNRAVFKEIDRMTGGEAASLHRGDSAKWNRMCAKAAENLCSRKK